MYQRSPLLLNVCRRCQRPILQHNVSETAFKRPFTVTANSPLPNVNYQSDDRRSATKEKQEDGAMSRRLSEMSEQILEDGGRSAKKAVEEAGFDEELKRRLLDRIADANFKNENPQAFAQVNLPASAGKEVRDTASAKPWTGTETVEDASLRMLNDSYKPLRRPAVIPNPTRLPKKIDTGRPKDGQMHGVRLANARDKSSMYSYMRGDNLTKEERDKMRQELKDRFLPGARSAPMTLRGLASLANERIEDAIARGQFKNLPRGKKIERDYNMSSPFLDTTEYFMNKIIQRQDIVPPWIEKQQELVSTVTKFRSRLRNDWRRHAARVIASRGGSLESQIARAEEYARAEAIVNPPKDKIVKVNTVDGEGHLSQISLSGQLTPPSDAASSGSIHITVTEEKGLGSTQETNVTPETEPGDLPNPSLYPSDVRVRDGTVIPFRDPSWEQNERSYHTLATENLNSLTRSYNLMAPNTARKPYYSLDRELRSCYADIAPQLANEIRERATAPKLKVDIISNTPGGVLERIGGGSAQVYDSRKPHYGFKEFWRDLFNKEQTV